MSNLNLKRLRQFKLISALLFSLLLAVLIYLAIRVLNSGSNSAIENNEAINLRNFIYSKGNSFGFTDKERKVVKPKGVFRIAVLGDSFIWGDGLPYEKVWSHKLEAKLLNTYDSIEVLHWGKNGWSTLDELNFFKDYGKDFNIDLLIIGWVDNDPDMGKIQQIYPGKADKEFPLLYKICRPLANVMLRYKKDNEYRKWINQIYSVENLNDYQNVLNDFHACTTQNNVSVLYVMTPGSFKSRVKEHFEIIKPMIMKANFSCLDLYASAEKKFEHYSNAELKANTANGHPGELMTEEFAAEVKSYLEQNHYLQNIPKR